MSGRYITVSSAHHLVLCEVDICGIKHGKTNVLIHKEIAYSVLCTLKNLFYS